MHDAELCEVWEGYQTLAPPDKLLDLLEGPQSWPFQPLTSFSTERVKTKQKRQRKEKEKVSEYIDQPYLLLS